MGASSLPKPLIYNDGTSGNYSFSASVLQFLADGAQLKLQDGQETFEQLFTNDTGFTYNASLAEFASGVVRQLDQTPANSRFAALFATKDLNWRKDAGALTGTLRGTPTFTAGRMVCTGDQGVNWARTTATIETYLIKYQPNYSGSPPSNVNVFGTGGTNDQCLLTHSPSGDNWRITLKNSTGTPVISTASIGASSINLSAATEYYLALVVNATAGTVQLYVKAGAGAWALHGTLSPGAWTRGGVTTIFTAGAAGSVYQRAEGAFDDLSVYNVALNPVSSAPVDPPVNIYLESKIDLPNFTFGGVGSIISVDSASVTEANGPRYIVAGRYWDGAAWSVSDGSFAQASPSADVIANLPDFPATGATIVPVSVVFGNSNLQMSVDEFSVTVTGTTAYPLTAQKVTENAGQLMDALDLFSLDDDNFDVPSGDSLTFTLCWAGQEYYWDGEEVAASDGTVNQSNSAAVIEANKAAFTEALGLGATVKVVVYFLSGDGTTTPKLRQLDIEYNFYNTQSDPSTCTIWGFYRGLNGVGIEGATVTFILQRAANQYREASNSIIGDRINAKNPTDANGRFEQDLIRSSNFGESGGTYYIEIREANNGFATLLADADGNPIAFTVPDQNDYNITEDLEEAA